MGYFDDLNDLATNLADESYGPSSGDASSGESIAVGEPAPDGGSAGLDSGSALSNDGGADPLMYWQPGGRRFFGDLGDAAARLVDQAQTDGGNAATDLSDDAPSPAFTVPNRRFGSLADDAQRLVNGQSSQAQDESVDGADGGSEQRSASSQDFNLPNRRFASLAEDAQRFVSTAREAGDGPELATPATDMTEAGTATAIVPDRRFASLSEDAQRLIDMARGTRQTEPDAPSEQVWANGSAALNQARRNTVGGGSSAERAAPTQDAMGQLRASLRTRRGTPAALVPSTTGAQAAASRVSAPAGSKKGTFSVGGYFIPAKPTQEITAYWRQWNDLTIQQAEQQAFKLAQVGVPPYLWEGGAWKPLYDPTVKKQPTSVAPNGGLHVGAYELGTKSWQQWDGLDEVEHARRINELLKAGITPFTWSDAAQRWIALTNQA